MVSMVKAEGRHRACDVWQSAGAPCTGHGPWCDRVVMVDVTTHGERELGIRVVGFVGEPVSRTLPTTTLHGTHARHAA